MRSLGSEIVRYDMETARVIVLGVPTFGTVSYEWHSHMMQLQNPMNRSVFHSAAIGAEVGDARNVIVDTALRFSHANGWTAGWVMFVDDDVLIPPHAIIRLLSHKVPIVSGLYFAKTDEPQPLMLGDDLNGLTLQWEKDSLVPCRVHGMGCTLIELGVFRKLIGDGLVEQGVYQGRPIHRFFATTRDALLTSDDGAPTVYNETEDAYFLKRAAQAGYQPLCDTGLKCWHWDGGKRTAYPARQWAQHISGQPVDWSEFERVTEGVA
jgi:hypothetical protein